MLDIIVNYIVNQHFPGKKYSEKVNHILYPFYFIKVVPLMIYDKSTYPKSKIKETNPNFKEQ